MCRILHLRNFDHTRRGVVFKGETPAERNCGVIGYRAQDAADFIACTFFDCGWGTKHNDPQGKSMAPILLRSKPTATVKPEDCVRSLRRDPQTAYLARKPI